MKHSQTAKTRRRGFKSLLDLINDPVIALSNRGVSRALTGDASGSMRDFRAAIRHHAELAARGDRPTAPAASNDDEFTAR